MPTATVSIFIVKIGMPDGSRGRFMGLFADGFAAVDQVLADFPDATSVSAIHVRGSRA